MNEKHYISTRKNDLICNMLKAGSYGSNRKNYGE